MIKKNLKPVSNLAFSGKLIEHIVADQIISYIDQYNLMEEKQSAYRKFHSTETALLKLKTDIIKAMDNQEITCLVLLNLLAAFATIDHTILLNRLKTFGIRDTALKWIASFLTGRTQKVAIGDLGTDLEATSDPVTLTLVCHKGVSFAQFCLPCIPYHLARSARDTTHLTTCMQMTSNYT